MVNKDHSIYHLPIEPARREEISSHRLGEMHCRLRKLQHGLRVGLRTPTLRVFVHPGIGTCYPEMCLNGVVFPVGVFPGWGKTKLRPTRSRTLQRTGLEEPTGDSKWNPNLRSAHDQTKLG